MRKIVYFIVLVSFNLFSQTPPPQGISHRGTVYRSNGQIVSNANVTIKVEILDYTTNPFLGTPIFTETFSPVHTNIYGQYSINIGNSTPANNVLFSQINWGNNTNKYLNILIDPDGGTNFTISGGNQLLSVPYALFSQTSQNTNTAIKVYNTINELRTKVGNPGEIVYIKGHSNYGDGGQGNFIWRDLLATDNKFPDNDGTIVRPAGIATGGWFRLIDGRINIRYFGVIGFHIQDGDRIQKAIDFAAKNAENSNENGAYFTNKTYAGSVVYIPTGNYLIKNPLILKSGVSIEGESTATTILTASNDQKNGNMIEMDSGRILGVNISNLTLTGGEGIGADNTKNAIYLKAKPKVVTKPGEVNDGGLWNATFKNIRINQFNGSGIILEGGGGAAYDYKLPNQDLIFENVNIARKTDTSACLLIQGQQGQMTFINCGFDGHYVGFGDPNATSMTMSKYYNVVIESKDHVQSSVIKFITCTFQYSEYGAFIKFGENITFDNCWFEMLDRAVGIVQSNTVPPLPSRGINIINSRFANASGFGSYYNKVTTANVIGGIPTGSCIYTEGAQVNVQGNYVAISDIYNENNLFIRNYSADSQINASNNSFQHPELGMTYGIDNNIINSTANTINAGGYRFVTVNSSASQINEIKSVLNAGETVTIRSNGNYVKFDTSKNILLTKASPVSLGYGETATFMKVDGTFVNGGVTYREFWQLISINKVN
ncbi:glycosyl hydrolase family 28-related protein [Flavobacterium lindanitolerans]|uniref:glycosyl hydrolase family 28-related protein n=1 Tax=Flavobacterium lindanitolerans TaxID=428988 RepID=UPI0027B9C709|nr:glycosyl hydrolase family 28-related protein [Flavobacterium lindanitolerans]